MTIKQILTGLFVLGLMPAFGQQEQMFTQYMYNKMALNPGYAGNDDYLGITLQLRDQWNGFPGSPEAQQLSVNLPRYGSNVGIGMNLRRRSIGIQKEIAVSGIYAYKLNFDESCLSGGLELHGKSRTMQFGDPRLVATEGLENDPSIPAENVTQTRVNVGFGLYFNTRDYFVGASLPNLIKTSLDFDNNGTSSRQVRHAYLMGGASFRLSDELRFNAQALLKFAEKSPIDTDINFGLTLKDRYTAAVGYRFGGSSGDIGESMALILSFQLTDRFMLGFSHDFTLSQIRKYDNGSFEIIGAYAFGPKSQKSVFLNPRYF